MEGSPRKVKSIPNARNNYVHLEPFIHQVGGHSSMLCLDDATVCKPLVQRELKFYQTLPEPVKKFAPKFYGVIQVQVEHEDDGYVALIATPPDCYEPKLANTKNKFRLRRTGSIEMDEAAEGLFDSGPSTSAAALNPWVVKCHRTHLHQLAMQDGAANFILLENLTWRFNFPCILDIKMGTRQYGDAASLPKKQSKMFKVVSTTSGKLGARIGGMQVYQVTTQRFLCHNKLYGRSLSVAGFQQALRQFLHNGARLRSDILPLLIRRLEELASVLACQDTVRFYTTSLLLLYEGEECQDTKDCRFKYSPCDLDCPVQEEAGGMGRRSSSAEVLSPLPVLDEPGSSYPMFHRCSSSNSLTYEEAQIDADSPLTTPLSPLPVIFSESAGPEPLVDVRMIDFAHSTHKGLNDPVVYSGPDRGFLFGLENMIALLKSIERDHG